VTDRTPGHSPPAPAERGAARAPLLAVLGGPTGAGKSTLLNSLVRAPVSAAGVLRPTTRQPVLVCNPRDWASVRRHGLRPICAPLMPEGIAIIDAPDVDSIEPANRALAEELFAEADLWLFITTASRYADAANWRHLSAARARRVALAVILDRVAAGHAQGIIDHIRDLLGPPEPPLFVIPEASLDRQGMLADSVAAPLRGWLADVVRAAREGPPQPADASRAGDNPPADAGRAGDNPPADAGRAGDNPPADGGRAASATDADSDTSPEGVSPPNPAGNLTVELELTPPEDGVPDAEQDDGQDEGQEADSPETSDSDADVVESGPPDAPSEATPAAMPKDTEAGETVKL
jgi:hypothetical protein